MIFLSRRLLTASLLFVGCGTTGELATNSTSVDPNSLRHEQLHGLLWTQTAVEYAAIAKGAYALAALRLDEALVDTMWTASLEQRGLGGFSSLPPAVVLDVDETVLDNSAFQARLIEDDVPFRGDIWNDWVQEEKAGAIPGALDFTRFAASKGVHVVYLTNREADIEQSTENNLIALGFPMNSGDLSVISKRERPEWSSSNKTLRREFVSQKYRILLLIGDNYGDFTEDAQGSISERARSSSTYDSYWGKKWIVLPNPMYGTWERALFDYDFSTSEIERLRMKRTRLRTDR
ncbi:MAG: 5'-nucleotidase, lipoprotein e(P4) family [Bacteroidetes bacterium]|nr:MAG: 5'-nucleotidase, lipoprotein e(P4) family [Bacteroidota bacterium]